MQRFWIVGKFDPSPVVGGAPMGSLSTNPRQHFSAYEATIEAERLARLHPGSQFVVFKAETASYIPEKPVKTYDLGKPSWPTSTF